jgi:hypothetical protein
MYNICKLCRVFTEAEEGQQTYGKLGYFLFSVRHF